MRVVRWFRCPVTGTGKGTEKKDDSYRPVIADLPLLQKAAEWSAVYYPSHPPYEFCVVRAIIEQDIPTPPQAERLDDMKRFCDDHPHFKNKWLDQPDYPAVKYEDMSKEEQEADPVETRYFRSDKHTINTYNVYKLITTNSASSQQFLKIHDEPNAGGWSYPFDTPEAASFITEQLGAEWLNAADWTFHSWGRINSLSYVTRADHQFYWVCKVSSAGVRTTIGVSTATDPDFTTSFTEKDAVWSCPETALLSTDAILIDNVRFNLTTNYGCVKYLYFICGNGTYNSRITGFSWTLTSIEVSTQDATDLDVREGRLNGTITDTGGENADEVGFDWGYSSGIPYKYSVTETGDFGTGTFNYLLDGLVAGNTVYFRAKAHNSDGWGFGSEKSFLVQSGGPVGKAESLREQYVTEDSNWQQACRLTWTPSSVGDWLVLVTFELHESFTAYYASGRVQLDDNATNKMEVSMEPTHGDKTLDYKRHASFFLLDDLSAVEHYIDVDYKNESAQVGMIAYIKNIRIVAWQLDKYLDSAEYVYEATEAELTGIGTTFTSVVSGSRNDTGKYLILFSIEGGGGNINYSTVIRGFVDGTYFPVQTETYTHLSKEAKDINKNYWGWLHGVVVTLSGATNFGIEVRSVAIAHAKVRRRRVIAIDLDALGLEGTNYIYDLDTAETSMTSETPSVRSQIQFTPASAQEYLILMTSAGRTDNLAYPITQDFYKTENSETVGKSIMDAKDEVNPADYWGACVVDIRELAASQHTFQNRWYRTEAGGTMYIKGSLVLAINLAITFIGSATAGFGATGVSSRVFMPTRTISSAVNVAGLTTRSWIGNRVASAVMSVVGLPARLTDNFRSIAASISQTATAVRQAAFTRVSGFFKFPYTFPFKFGSVSGIGTATTAFGSWVVIRVASAAVGIVGVAERGWTGIRDAIAEMSTTPTTQRQFVGERSATSSMGVTAIATKIQILSRTALAAMSAVGTSIRNWVGSRDVTASVSQVATTTRAIVVTRAASGVATIVGTVGRMYGALRTIAAVIDMEGVTIRGWIGTRSTEAVMNIISSIQRSWVGTRSALAAFSIVGATAKIYGALRSAIASVGVAGTAVRGWVGTRTALATTSIVGVSARMYGSLRSVAAVIGLVGTTIRGLVGTRFSIASMTAVGTTARSWIGTRIASVSIGLSAITVAGKAYFRSAIAAVSMIGTTVRISHALRTVIASVSQTATAIRVIVVTRFSGLLKFPYTFPFKFGSTSGIGTVATATRNWVSTRVVSAVMGITGAVSRSFVGTRAALAAFNTTGTAVRVWIGERIASATVSVVGIAARLKYGLRSASASLSQIAVISREVILTRAAVASMTVESIANRMYGTFRSAVAGVDIVGTAVRSWIGTRFASAVMSVVGITNRIKIVIRVIAAAIGIIGTTGREWIGTRISVASISAVGVAVRSWIGTRFASVSVGLSAIVVAARAYLRSATATMEMTGIAVRSWIGTRAVSVVFNIIGTAGRVAAIIKTAASTISVTGITVRSWVGTRVTSASVNIISVSSRLKYGLRSASAVLNQTAIAVREITVTRSVSAAVSVTGIAVRIIEAFRSAVITITVTADIVRGLVLERSRSAVIGVTTVGGRIYSALRTAIASISVVADVWFFRYLSKRLATLQLVGKTSLLKIAGKTRLLNVAGKTHLLNITGKIHLLNTVSKTRLLNTARKEKTLLLSTKAWILDLADKIRELKFGR